MKQVALFNREIANMANGRVVHDSPVQHFDLNSHLLTCGLISCDDLKFNSSDPNNADKVLIRKKAFSCNYRDKALAVDAQKKIEDFALFNKAKYYTLGSEFVGEVVAIGNNVENFEIGDHVIGNGSYPDSDYPGVRPGLPTNNASMEFQSFHFSKLVKVPKSMPLEVAASFPIGGQTVYSMIRRLSLKAKEIVLVTSATSNTSLFAISALKQQDVRVCAVTTRGEYVQRLKDQGAEDVFVIDRKTKSLAESNQVQEYIKQNGPFNAVIDPFFDVYLSKVIDVIAIGGRYITCGLYDQPHIASKSVIDTFSTDLVYVMKHVMLKNISILGNCIGVTTDLEKAIEDYTAGELDIVIDSIYEKENVAAFFNRSFNSPDRFGKVVYKY